jgi:hypothetical protein
VGVTTIHGAALATWEPVTFLENGHWQTPGQMAWFREGMEAGCPWPALPCLHGAWPSRAVSHNGQSAWCEPVHVFAGEYRAEAIEEVRRITAENRAVRVMVSIVPVLQFGFVT